MEVAIHSFSKVTFLNHPKRRLGRTEEDDPTWSFMTWNLFVLYFEAQTLQNKVLSNQNKGHLGSRDNL